MNPSDSARCSCRQCLTQRRTDEYEPANPCPATKQSNTRLAVCRCLRGIPRSARSHESTTRAYGSTRLLACMGHVSGRGEKSSISAYLATVLREMPRRLAIAERDNPSIPYFP
ncbi:hypothetical protein [Bifidobacterium mongoliense]|nr:hypothetical protein [Bifidobacterium mongoliense]MDN6782823.1 hypothetical protein [Bifidobacterium mongoliense]